MSQQLAAEGNSARETPLEAAAATLAEETTRHKDDDDDVDNDDDDVDDDDDATAATDNDDDDDLEQRGNSVTTEMPLHVSGKISSQLIGSGEISRC